MITQDCIEINPTEAGWAVHLNGEHIGAVLARIHGQPDFIGYLAVSMGMSVISRTFTKPGEAIDYLLATWRPK
jgi:hypothetical protein